MELTIVTSTGGSSEKRLVVVDVVVFETCTAADRALLRSRRPTSSCSITSDLIYTDMTATTYLRVSRLDTPIRLLHSATSLVVSDTPPFRITPLPTDVLCSRLSAVLLVDQASNEQIKLFRCFIN
ncbi:hypothetical protein KIN20_001123 [Parelaphostrongylus tenuis]|uniref:Uncharacterized protein n=1 Tax=Parelaphostrongylus tenuis TaxID=148309 RepID=A0AAD5QEA8_PARTN|nr:hypothetical protein KIN20_001123 [Parelaphostrongylus tenuis]